MLVCKRCLCAKGGGIKFRVRGPTFGSRVPNESQTLYRSATLYRKFSFAAAVLLVTFQQLKQSRGVKIPRNFDLYAIDPLVFVRSDLGGSEMCYITCLRRVLAAAGGRKN